MRDPNRLPGPETNVNLSLGRLKYHKSTFALTQDWEEARKALNEIDHEINCKFVPAYNKLIQAAEGREIPKSITRKREKAYDVFSHMIRHALRLKDRGHDMDCIIGSLNMLQGRLDVKK